MENNTLTCPVCKNSDFTAKYEAKYVYSYKIDSNAPGSNNREIFLSFLYDKREQEEAKQYIECNICKTNYPCFFTEGNRGIDYDALQRAIHHGHFS